jgi:hypothetical protein
VLLVGDGDSSGPRIAFNKVPELPRHRGA